MNENELPCLDLLEATPDILRGLMAEVSDEDARWKPAPDRFSIAEVLAHLSHSEGHCYGARVDKFLSEDLLVLVQSAEGLDNLCHIVLAVGSADLRNKRA